MQNYILDIVILLIIAFCGYRGYKNGIMSGIITIVSGFLGLIGANLWTPLIAPYVGKVIGPLISKQLLTAPDAYLSKLIPAAKLPAFLQSAMDSGYDALTGLTNELTNSIQEFIAFLIIFVIIMMLASHVLQFLSLNLPLFRTVNRTLGWVFGACVGLLLSCILFGASLSYMESQSNYITLIPYFENSFFYEILWSKL